MNNTLYHKKVERLGKQIANSEHENEKKYNFRGRNRSKISYRYNRKIEKSKNAENVSETTQLSKKYDYIIKKYKDVVLSELNDPQYVKNGREETKRIIAAYKTQKTNDEKYRGSVATKMLYAINLMSRAHS